MGISVVHDLVKRFIHFSLITRSAAYYTFAYSRSLGFSRLSFERLPQLQLLIECLRHYQGEYNCGVRRHFHWLRIYFDLAPRYSFVGTGTRVTTIKFLSCIDIHGEFRTITHEVCIAAVMLDDSASQNNPRFSTKSIKNIIK